MTRLLLSRQIIVFVSGLLLGTAMVLGYIFWLNSPNYSDTTTTTTITGSSSWSQWSPQMDTAGGSVGYGRKVFPHKKRAAMSKRDGRESIKPVRILCWILSGPGKHAQRAAIVKETWGKRCDKLLFMSSVADDRLGSIALEGTEEGREWLWAKTKAAFEYIWSKHREDADWFLKADTDTYVILENLRTFLSIHNSSESLHFGLKFNNDVINDGGYMYGGPGYVLSKKTLERFVMEALPEETICEPAVTIVRENHRGDEDVELARCLRNIGGVTMIDPKDNRHRSRFLQNSPAVHAGLDELPESDGDECCTDTVLSFHRVSENQHRMLEYLLYHVRIPQDPDQRPVEPYNPPQIVPPPSSSVS